MHALSQYYMSQLTVISGSFARAFSSKKADDYETQKKCPVLRHFLRVFTVCQNTCFRNFPAYFVYRYIINPFHSDGVDKLHEVIFIPSWVHSGKCYRHPPSTILILINMHLGPNKKIPVFRVTQPYLNLLVKPRIFSGFQMF